MQINQTNTALESSLDNSPIVQKNSIWALIIAMLIGISFVTLLWGYDLRINYFLMTVLLTGAAGWIMHLDNNLDYRHYAFWSTTLLSLSSVYARLMIIEYRVMIFLLWPVLFVMMTMYCGKYTLKRPFITLLLRTVGSIAFVDKIFIALGSLFKKSSPTKKTSASIVLGIGISAVLLLVIIPIMFSADAAFKTMVIDVFDLSNLGIWIGKSIVALVISILFFGFLYIITVKKNMPDTSSKTSESKSIQVNTTLLTILISIGLVYTVFAIAQSNYLFSGGHALPNGMSYTEYARSGYFELVFLSVINFLLILTAVHIADKNKGVTHRIIQGLLLYFCVLNVYMMASAAYRMYLYQSHFGYTVLRVLVYILIAFELILLVMLAIKIFRHQMPYIRNAVYISLCFWAIVGYINLEAFCVEQNIQSYFNGGQLDIEYMTSLSPDAAVPLKRLYDTHFDDLDKDEQERLLSYFQPIMEYENGGYMIADFDPDLHWLEFNLSDHRWRGFCEELTP